MAAERTPTSLSLLLISIASVRLDQTSSLCEIKNSGPCLPVARGARCKTHGKSASSDRTPRMPAMIVQHRRRTALSLQLDRGARHCAGTAASVTSLTGETPIRAQACTCSNASPRASSWPPSKVEQVKTTKSITFWQATLHPETGRTRSTIEQKADRNAAASPVLM